jgi:hypothetical protein
MKKHYRAGTEALPLRVDEKTLNCQKRSDFHFTLTLWATLIFFLGLPAT